MISHEEQGFGQADVQSCPFRVRHPSVCGSLNAGMAKTHRSTRHFSSACADAFGRRRGNGKALHVKFVIVPRLCPQIKIRGVARTESPWAGSPGS
jgi:hypothetical protein